MLRKRYPIRYVLPVSPVYFSRFYRLEFSLIVVHIRRFHTRWTPYTCTYIVKEGRGQSSYTYINQGGEHSLITSRPSTNAARDPSDAWVPVCMRTERYNKLLCRPRSTGEEKTNKIHRKRRWYAVVFRSRGPTNNNEKKGGKKKKKIIINHTIRVPCVCVWAQVVVMGRPSAVDTYVSLLLSSLKLNKYKN